MSEKSLYSEFLSKEKTRGILRIRNLLNGKCYLATSEDFVRSYKDIRFSLDLGMFECEELQEEYGETGLEVFVIEPELTCGKDEDLDAALKQVVEKYIREGRELYK